MAEPDSELTPPKTPEEVNVLPCAYEPKIAEKYLFNCIPEKNWLTEATERLSEFQSRHEIPQNSSLKLANRYFKRSVFFDDPSSVFNLIRLGSSIITTSIPYSSGSQLSSATECYNCRIDIASTFSCLRSELKSILETACSLEDKNVTLRKCSTILQEIKKILVFIGRISDLSDYVIQINSNLGTQTNLLAGHVFHFYLELWCTVVDTVDIVVNNDAGRNYSFNVSFCSGDTSASENIFVQVAVLLLWDLCFLAEKCYSKTALSDICKITPFTCTCIKEAWAMLYILFSKHQDTSCENMFWICVHQIFEHILQSHNGTGLKLSKDHNLYEFNLIPKSFGCCQPSLFCLWILTYIAELTTEVSQEVFKSSKLFSDYKEAKKLVSLILSLQDEAALRIAINCCTTLCLLWEPSIELILPLTDYFLKQLDDSFQLNTSSVQNLMIMCESGSRLLSHVKEKTNASYTWKASDTSFQMFLRLLALSVKRFKEIGATHLWRQLKGRIYSKFHLRRLEELTERGLQNCFSLFLALVLSGDTEDVVKKMLDLFEMLHSISHSPNKLAVGLKAMFAVILEYQSRGLNLKYIGTKISEWFTSLCVETPGQTTDGQLLQRRSILLKVYLEDLDHVFECGSNLSLQEESLLNLEFSHILTQCSPSEQSSILITAQQIIGAVRFAYKKNTTKDGLSVASLKPMYENLSNTLFTILLPHVYKTSSSRSILPQLPDTAVELSLLSLILPSTVPLVLKATFQNLFEVFGCTAHTSPKFACRYLSHILENQDAFESLKVTIPNYESQLIKSSFRCSLGVPPPCEQTLALLRTVLSMKEVASLLLATCDTHQEDHGNLMAEFFHSVGKNYRHLLCSNNAVHGASLRQNFQKYFQDYLPTVENILRTSPSLNHCLHLYKVTGHLILSCSPLLYVKGKPGCLFPQLMDCLILPASLYKEKALPPHQMSSIKETLPLYIRGLMSLNIQQDPYLQRMLKSIFTIYLPVFAVQQHRLFSTGEHPLLASIKFDQKDFVEQRQDLIIKYIAEAVSENFLSKKGSGHSHLEHALSFARELVKVAKSHQYVTLFSILLPVILDHCIASDHNRKAQELLEIIMRLSRQAFSAEDRKQYLIPVVKSFSEHHIAWAASRAFALLEKILALYPELVIDSLTDVTFIVQKVEDKRGVGHDQVLRRCLMELVSCTEKASSNLQNKTCGT